MLVENISIISYSDHLNIFIDFFALQFIGEEVLCCCNRYFRYWILCSSLWKILLCLRIIDIGGLVYYAITDM